MQDGSTGGDGSGNAIVAGNDGTKNGAPKYKSMAARAIARCRDYEGKIFCSLTSQVVSLTMEHLEWPSMLFVSLLVPSEYIE